MKRTQVAAFVAVIALQVPFFAACTTFVRPTVTRVPDRPLTPDAVIFVHATRDRRTIIDALSRAGIRTSQEFKQSDYALEVRVGRSRGNTSCGGISNVAYLLRGQDQPIMLIKGRGVTGYCLPNMFDDMSQELATYIGR